MSDIRKRKALHAHATVCVASSGCGALRRHSVEAQNARRELNTNAWCSVRHAARTGRAGATGNLVFHARLLEQLEKISEALVPFDCTGNRAVPVNHDEVGKTPTSYGRGISFSVVSTT